MARKKVNGTAGPSASEVLRHLEQRPVKWVRGALQRGGITAPTLAEQTGLPASTCRAFLNGGRDNPTAEQFRLFLTSALNAAEVQRG